MKTFPGPLLRVGGLLRFAVRVFESEKLFPQVLLFPLLLPQPLPLLLQGLVRLLRRFPGREPLRLALCQIGIAGQLPLHLLKTRREGGNLRLAAAVRHNGLRRRFRLAPIGRKLGFQGFDLREGGGVLAL